MNLSKNFARSEFNCSCGCGFDTADLALVSYLQSIRDHFQQPVKITSACRCPEYNKSVGGVENSQHVLGRAADIQVSNIAPSIVAKYAIDVLDCGGVGNYDTFTHIDSRNIKARW